MLEAHRYHGPMPDHRAAAIELFRRYIDKMERGTSGSDVGEELILLARIVAGRT